MGFLGNVLSTAVNIVNIPAETLDWAMSGEDDLKNRDRFLSEPLHQVSKLVKKVDE